MYIKMTHCGLQLILCCVVMTDDDRAMCFLNAVINALQLSGSEFCSVGGFYTLTLVDKTDHHSVVSKHNKVITVIDFQITLTPSRSITCCLYAMECGKAGIQMQSYVTLETLLLDFQCTDYTDVVS